MTLPFRDRTRVVRVGSTTSAPRLVRRGLSAGVVVATITLVYAFCLSPNPGRSWFQQGVTWLMVANWVAFIGIFATLRQDLIRVLHGLALGLGYAAGLCTPVVSFSLIVSLALYPPRIALGVVLLVSLAAVIAGAAIGAGLAWCLTHLGPRIVVQDGTLCPRCVYSLIGNTSMRCPECGRAFTFAELGTTEEAFRERSDAAGRAQG